jgi:hypothetical protein
MHDITTFELNSVAGGAYIYGDSIPVSFIQNIQHEATNDARKAGVVIGLATAWITSSLLPMSMVAAASISMASLAYSYEYSSSWNVLSYTQ